MTSARFRILSAVHLFLISEDQILLLRRQNTGYEDGNYSVVAGHLDGDEPVERAMIREAEEEAGIKLDLQKLDVIGVMHRKSDDERIDFFLAAHSWSGEISNLESHKCDHLAWFKMDQLPENTIPYVRRAIENFRRGIWFDSYGW
jgi:8-oxo-dGTP diphosphatase